MPYTLFIPALFADDLETNGLPPRTAAMKCQERKKDIGRVEGALESLGVPFKHQRVGTSATLSAAEKKSLLALLPDVLPHRAELDFQELDA